MTLADLNLRTDQVRSLYLLHLQQMYSAEEMMLPATPTLAIAVSMPEVKQVLLIEASNAPERLTLLGNIFTDLGELPTGPPCLPVKTLVDQSNEVNMQLPFGPERDLLLLSIALEMKHSNIAKYMMAVTYARTLRFPEHAQALSNVQRDEIAIELRLKSILQEIQMFTATP